MRAEEYEPHGEQLYKATYPHAYVKTVPPPLIRIYRAPVKRWEERSEDSIRKVFEGRVKQRERFRYSNGGIYKCLSQKPATCVRREGN